MDSKLPDSVAENRAVGLFKVLRCLTCAGESIYESHSQLAHDLRSVIRQKVASGYSDSEVVLYLKNNYGERILNYPQFKAETYLLWVIPLLILTVGMLSLLFYNLRR